ncbi:hypothetical protein AZE42_01118 [Rhizopogon vesiculosus]|uniref:Uncharacterized protein n=1 Tax=Rhizopogon vesiculosus TaxID=180088 RepID=A0A1J8PEF9_9AGAM|nr:hypothetical protein AZE42_01118 [Rhizopogon vesiculosus]
MFTPKLYIAIILACLLQMSLALPMSELAAREPEAVRTYRRHSIYDARLITSSHRLPLVQIVLEVLQVDPTGKQHLKHFVL